MMNRLRKLERRPPQRERKPRTLVVCEGQVTEPLYIEGVRRSFRNSLVEIEVIKGGGTPKTLVETAVARKRAAADAAARARDNSLLLENVWCVYDVDDHPKLTDAKQQADAHGIKLAISNPCIELWLLIHFSDQRASIGRHKLSSLLRQHVKGYDKHIAYEVFHPLYGSALVRAKQLSRDRKADGNVGENPSTDFYLLTEEIISNGIR